MKGKLQQKLDRLLDHWYLKRYENNFDPVVLPAFPARHLRSIVGHPTLMLYASVGQEFGSYLKLLAGLKPNHKVLDVGCGCGRIAAFLVGTITAPGCYDGFDVVPELIEDARERITKLNPLFQFKLVSIYNQLYNPVPTASRDSEFVFPYPDSQYDLVFLTSVFTHLLPAGLKNYVQQIYRVTRKGGKCFATFFLRQNSPDSQNSWKLSAVKQRLVSMTSAEDSSFFSVRFLFKIT